MSEHTADHEKIIFTPLIIDHRVFAEVMTNQVANLEEETAFRLIASLLSVEPLSETTWRITVKDQIGTLSFSIPEPLETYFQKSLYDKIRTQPANKSPPTPLNLNVRIFGTINENQPQILYISEINLDLDLWTQVRNLEARTTFSP